MQEVLEYPLRFHPDSKVGTNLDSITKGITGKYIYYLFYAYSVPHFRVLSTDLKVIKN